MDLTPRWRGSGKPIKPGLFALMVLLPAVLAVALLSWIFSQGVFKETVPTGKMKPGPSYGR